MSRSILLLGERHPDELPACIEHRLTVSVGELGIAERLSALSTAQGGRVPIHLKVDTGMSRFGVRWDSAVETAIAMLERSGLELEGVMSHFAMSDEADKTFAHIQLRRFKAVLTGLEKRGIQTRWQHICNTGGLLDQSDPADEPYLPRKTQERCQIGDSVQTWLHVKSKHALRELNLAMALDAVSGERGE